MEADELTIESLSSKLGRTINPNEQIPKLLFVDSFLSNQQAISALPGYIVKNVVAEVKKGNEVSFQEGAK